MFFQPLARPDKREYTHLKLYTNEKRLHCIDRDRCGDP